MLSAYGIHLSLQLDTARSQENWRIKGDVNGSGVIPTKEELSPHQLAEEEEQAKLAEPIMYDILCLTPGKLTYRACDYVCTSDPPIYGNRNILYKAALHKIFLFTSQVVPIFNVFT